MLLNEVQKQQRVIQSQTAHIASQSEHIASQAARIDALEKQSLRMASLLQRLESAQVAAR
jgi:small-conductance mechanosensitive channel